MTMNDIIIIITIFNLIWLNKSTIFNEWSHLFTHLRNACFKDEPRQSSNKYPAANTHLATWKICWIFRAEGDSSTNSKQIKHLFILDKSFDLYRSLSSSLQTEDTRLHYPFFLKESRTPRKKTAVVIVFRFWSWHKPSTGGFDTYLHFPLLQFMCLNLSHHLVWDEKLVIDLVNEFI